MREQRESEVCTCGIAGKDDVARIDAEILENVVEEGGCLLELPGIGGARSKVVGEEEDRGGFPVRREYIYYLE